MRDALSVHVLSRRRKIMNRPTTLTLMAIALLSLAVVLPADNALAQQKQQVSFKTPAENTKYGQQQNIDVGDVPNHIVRVFEVHTTFPNNAPVIGGLKPVEIWQRGITDLTDGNGNTTSYLVYVMENGDKFFVRGASVVQNTAGKLTATAVGHITGGTGKLAAIQGTTRNVTSFDLKAGGVPGDSQTEIEYSLGK
jgi:hypothetical protein